MEEAGPPGVRVERARADIQPVVVEAAAREPEEADGQFQPGERPPRRAGREADAQEAAQVAAQPEAHHERGHDHRDGVDAHAAVQREQALPGDLVDQRGRAAQEEGDAEEADPRAHARGS